jgi:hypothetical protein
MNFELDVKDFEGSFNRIASELMNEYVLKVENTEYRVTEIEFYYKDDMHNDTYIHSHPLQKTKGKWYFHGSGIDLTFGSEEAFGGILLRAIYNLNSGAYIYGPINIITEIFGNIHSIFEINLSFGFVSTKVGQFNFEEPIHVPRVGLNSNKNSKMYEKPYRFLIMPKQKHAEKTRIAESMQKQGFSKEAINKIWGY